MDKYVLRGHEPVYEPDLMKWAREYENREKSRVAFNVVSDDVMVSTMFLGIDHSFGDGSPPLLFETMVFGGPLDQEQDRYATWDEAAAGHAAMVALAERAERGEE